MLEEWRLIQRDTGNLGDWQVRWLGGVRRLCVPLRSLVGGGRGTDRVITKCAAPREGSA